jgi:hypothetical protein
MEMNSILMTDFGLIWFPFPLLDSTPASGNDALQSKTLSDLLSSPGQAQINSSSCIQKYLAGCFDDADHHLFTGGTAKDNAGSLRKSQQRADLALIAAMSTFGGSGSHLCSEYFIEQARGGVRIQHEFAVDICRFFHGYPPDGPNRSVRIWFELIPILTSVLAAASTNSVGPQTNT